MVIPVVQIMGTYVKLQREAADCSHLHELRKLQSAVRTFGLEQGQQHCNGMMKPN